MKPLTINLTGIGRDYPEVFNCVRDEGHETSPRGQKIKEVNPLILKMSEPQHCVTKRPGFNPSLMWLEIAQLLAGVYEPKLYEAVSLNAARNLNRYGAYGPRIATQMEHVVDELRRDPDSRRAMVYVGRPDDLRLADELDMACTATLQFLIRSGTTGGPRLDMIVNMRSWDLVWGLGYDVPCFVSIQMALAKILNREVGHYVHVAGSGHLYERHWDLKVERNTSAGVTLLEVFAHPTSDWWHVSQNARYLLALAYDVLVNHSTQKITEWHYVDEWAIPLQHWCHTAGVKYPYE